MIFERKLGVLAILVGTLILAFGIAEPAEAACASGYSCPSGTCAVYGADCCGRFGRDRYCSPGTICHPDGGCCPDNTITVRGGGCLNRSSERVCSNGTSFCNAGEVCIAGNKCLSVTSERYCGNRQYCDAGSYCVGGGRCRSHAADAQERLDQERRVAAEAAARAAEEARRILEEQARAAEAARAREEAAQKERERAAIARQPTSCSTITDKDHPSSGPCTNATRKLNTAKEVRRHSPRQAANEYRQAAEAFRFAGDAIQAAAALKEALELESAPPISSGVSPAPAPVSSPELTFAEIRIPPQNPQTCDASVAQQKTEIEAKIARLTKEEPLWRDENRVEVGSCSSRLVKLYQHNRNFWGPPLGLRTIASRAANWEERSCLQLKLDYLTKACECSKKGLTLSTDEALQDQTLEAYTKVREFDEKHRNEAIQNPIINRIVTEAADVRDCFNIGTIETLRNTQHALERALAK